MIVNRLLLASVLPAVTTEDTRYALSSIEVRNGGADVIAVATDGHILIKATTRADLTPDAEFPTAAAPELTPTDKALIPAAVAEDTIKATKRNLLNVLRGAKIGIDPAGRVIAAITDSRTGFRTFDLTEANAPDRNFPEHDRVMKLIKPAAVHVVLGVPMLEKLAKAAKAGGATTIKFEIPADDTRDAHVMDAVVASWTAKDDPAVAVQAVVMPCRP